MSIELVGNWEWGSSYDIHTISSERYIDQDGNVRWNNTRSEMGELVYQLKYQNNRAMVGSIIDLILKGYRGLDTVDAIIPAPPSKERRFQPVFDIALELGKKLNIQVYLDLLGKNMGSQELKGIENPDERQKALVESMYIDNNHNIVEKTILLVDDLYRSGSTLTVATDLLYSKANVKNVYVLTMTKTRSKR